MRVWCSSISAYPASPCSAKRHEELEPDKPARPLRRIRQRIERRARGVAGSRGLGGHVSHIGSESLCHAFTMPAKKHSASHGNGEPLVRVAGDGVRALNAREMGPEAG